MPVKGKLGPSKGRSRITNGRHTFVTDVADGKFVRLFRDRLAAVEAERGGRDAMTAVQWQAARAWVALSVEMHRIEAAISASGEELPEHYGVLCDRANRQVRRMGPVKAPPRLTLEQRLAAQKG